MKLKAQKRSRTQDPSLLDKDANAESLVEWLMHVNSQNEDQRNLAITDVLQTYPHALVDELLSNITKIDLFRVLSLNSFKTIRSLSELIRLGFDDNLNAAHKLLLFTRKVLKGYKSIGDENLSAYWKVLEISIKHCALYSFSTDVLSSIFTHVNEAFATELMPHLDEEHWLALLAHDDFAFCRQLINSPDVALTLKKLKTMMKNRFTESHQAIIFACLKNAILQDRYNFFEAYTQQVKDHIEIIIPVDQFDLLITAYKSKNPSFLTLILKNIVEYLRRKTLALVATWLSIELTSLEIENDNLRSSIISDLSNILQDRELMSNYDTVKNAAETNEAINRLLKVRSTQLPEGKKRTALTILNLHRESGTTLVELHKHILNRSSRDQHRVLDEKELAATRVLNEFIGYKQKDLPHSQLSQHNDYNRFKENTLARFDSMREKNVLLEISKLQNEIARFRESNLESYRRMIMPRPTRSEQESDVTKNIMVQVNKLSRTIPVVWVNTLDLEMWASIGSPHQLIPGMNEHLTLSRALLNRWDLSGTKPMFIASIGFFVQTKGNMTPFIHVPIRFPDHKVVVTSPNFTPLTTEADNIVCAHPLRVFTDYLLKNSSAIPQILKQGFNMERRANVTRVIASTFDIHTNTMPCKDCQEYVAQIQRSEELLKVVRSGLKNLSIECVKGNMPMTLLFRFSLLSMKTPAKVDLLEAEPVSTLTPPSSQSPSTHSSKKSKKQTYDKENISTVLLASMKKSILVKDVEPNPIQGPKQFTPRFYASPQVNARDLCQNSAVFHELEVPRVVFADKQTSSSVKDYTALIGKCM